MGITHVHYREDSHTRIACIYKTAATMSRLWICQKYASITSIRIYIKFSLIPNVAKIFTEID